MLELMDGFGQDVIALRATGKVTAEDYRSVLGPAVERAVAGGHKIRMLLELGPDFDGYDMGAMFSDARFGSANINTFEKLAIVTDNDMFRFMIERFASMMPAAVRVFSVAELETARSWIGEPVG